MPRNVAADEYVTTPNPTIPPVYAQVLPNSVGVLLEMDEMTARHLAAALSLFGTELAPRVRILRDRLDHALLGRPWSPARERRLAEEATNDG